MITNYLKFEVLDESVHCSKCNRKTKTAQQYYIAKAPRLLYVQLLYFNMDNSRVIPVWNKSKQQIWVQKEIMINENYYLLSSIIVHKGEQRQQGHYICIGRSINDCKTAWTRKGYDTDYQDYGDWHYANDKMKRSLDIKEVNKYLLTENPAPENYYRHPHFDNTCVYIACYVKIDNHYLANNMPSSQLFTKNPRTNNDNENMERKIEEEYEFINLNTDDDETDMHFYTDNNNNNDSLINRFDNNHINTNSNNKNCCNNNNNDTYNFSTNYNQRYQYTFNSIENRNDEETEEEEGKEEEKEAGQTQISQEGIGSDGDTIMNDHGSQLESMLPNLKQ